MQQDNTRTTGDYLLIGWFKIGLFIILTCNAFSLSSSLSIPGLKGFNSNISDNGFP
jgi:hypothetical protein